MFRLTNENHAHLVSHLANWDLMFEVPYQNGSDSAWKTLDQLITDHLQRNKIDIAPPSQLLDHPYHNLSWTLCKSGRSNKAGIKIYAAHKPPVYTFTFEFLHNIAQPDPIDQGYNVFFVGQYTSRSSIYLRLNPHTLGKQLLAYRICKPL